MLDPAQPVIEVDLPNEAATAGLAARLAGVSGPGDVIALRGGLGSGKTAFARAFIRSLGDADEEVPSPTFTLVQVYDSPQAPIYHFDFYRIERADEVLELGFEEALADGITLIEWPERAGPLLPDARLDLTFAQGGEPDARVATLEGRGYWRARLTNGMDGYFGAGAGHG